jgi:hypothetical protein
MSSNHYRCQEVFVTDTRATRITDTYVFHHKRITNPSISKADAIMATASDLTTAIKDNFKENITKLNLSELERLAQIFEEAAKKVSKANAGNPRVVNDDTEAPPLQGEEDDNEDETSEGAEPPRVANDTDKDPKQHATAPREASANHRETERLQLPTLRHSRRLNTKITTYAMLMR